MKLIGVISGTSLVRVAPEEVTPSNGVPWPELITALNSRYKFAQAVPPPPNLPPQVAPWLLFQNGEFDQPSGKAAILQLGFTRGGAMIVAQSSEIAEAALIDLISYLDQNFGFRIASSRQKRDYISDVVVEFAPDIDTRLGTVVAIERVINGLAQQSSAQKEFRIKRIAFGREGFDPAERQVGPANPLDIVEATEFQIERRVNHPYSENRFYCRAPMRTKDHLAALEMIEKAITGGSST